MPAAASVGEVEIVKRHATADQVVLDTSAVYTTQIPVLDTETAVNQAPKYNPRQYQINCNTYPQICENWCIYVFCEKHGAKESEKSPFWNVTVNRAPRSQSECTRYSPNKCSVESRSPWPANPVPGMECNDTPRITTSEGGSEATTRCVPHAENIGESAAWTRFIDVYGGPNTTRIDDVTIVTVVLLGEIGEQACLPLEVPGASICHFSAAPNDPDIAKNAIRQQWHRT
ncbi:hypothetical protein PsYK624_160930 [Phanerochaete sordida]|uniref:Deoxyribonuclease NucA/NucB domain-containing protein n=1 Tax=Phanerochaete sordida TaxID=48140 RepID=A0A9P3LLS2_9APHY|nr:hypothetical protein PsYK624_160930 [Phanerochaete sordida]